MKLLLKLFSPYLIIFLVILEIIYFIFIWVTFIMSITTIIRTAIIFEIWGRIEYLFKILFTKDCWNIFNKTAEKLK